MLKFNIIFTPGIVKHLRLFILSLLKSPSCQFRLVSNFCSNEEDSMLIEFCTIDDRLEFHRLPFKKLVEHSRAITYLLDLDVDEYFCFMDPDIVASGDFMAQFLPYLKDYSGIFSGTAIWLSRAGQILPKSETNMGGRFNCAHNNFCLGSTFFAIYNRNVLHEYLSKESITFNKYLKWEYIPEKYHSQLISADLKMRRYDTGKVLNILLQLEGEKFIFEDSSMLYHIGGLSSLTVGPLAKVKKKGICRILKKRSSGNYLRQIKRYLNNSETKYIRRDVADYFTALLDSLFDGTSLPAEIHVKDKKINNDLHTARQIIIDLYNENQALLIQ